MVDADVELKTDQQDKRIKEKGRHEYDDSPDRPVYLIVSAEIIYPITK